jgi:hypothetical protein
MRRTTGLKQNNQAAWNEASLELPNKAERKAERKASGRQSRRQRERRGMGESKVSKYQPTISLQALSSPFHVLLVPYPATPTISFSVCV